MPQTSPMPWAILSILPIIMMSVMTANKNKVKELKSSKNLEILSKNKWTW